MCLAGQTRPLRDAVALTAEEGASGWILTCTHEAMSSLDLDIEDLGALAGISEKTLPARIDALERVASDVMRVELRLPTTTGFNFVAGQSISLTGPSGARRSYSLAGDPSRLGRIELHVREVPGGVLSAYWFGEAKVNDLLRFRGPSGTFFLREVSRHDVVFLATGTGIAPITSMLAQLNAMPDGSRPASVALYWGGRVPQDLYCDPSEIYPELEYVPVLSRAGAGWHGERGYVQDVFLSRTRADRNTDVYACGSEVMVNAARRTLLAAGLPPRRFHFDAFVSSA
jgi:CDP-4-dehydro-6-deoxyglucose reductase